MEAASSAVMCVVLIYFNNMILPDANHRTANLMSDIARKRPAAFIEEGVLVKDFTNYAIYVEKADGRTGALTNVRIFSDVPGEQPSTTVARRGEVKQTPDGDYLRLVLFDGETHSIDAKNPNQYFVGRFVKQVFFIKNVDSDLHRTNSSYRGDREKSSEDMLADVAEFRKRRAALTVEFDASLDSTLTAIGRMDSALCRAKTSDSTFVPLDSVTTFAAWATRVRSHAAPTSPNIERRTTEAERMSRRIRSQDTEINRYMVEVHKKYATSVVAIVFVLIGAPLGIMARRGGLAVGASYSVIFFIIYWAFLIQGEAMADRLMLEPWIAMWGGNILIGACGLFLIARMVRETTFINFSRLILLWERISGNAPTTAGRQKTPLLQRIVGLPFKALAKAAGLLPMYVIRLFLGYASGLLAAIVIVFTVVDYVSNTRRFLGVPFSEVMRYYWYYLPWIIQMIFPVVMLLASMFAMGRLAKNSELTAMKAAGRSIRRATVPLLLLGTLLAGASFYVGEQILPEANQRRQTLMDDIRESRARGAPGTPYARRDFHRNFYYFGSKNVLYCFEEFRTRPTHTKNVWRESFDGSRVTQRIQAASMTYENGQWRFVTGSVRSFSGDSSSLAVFDSLPDSLLYAPPEEMVVRIKSPEEMSYWELADYIEKTRKRGEDVLAYLGDLHFKIAYPTMNIIVLLLGISITARAGRGGGALLFGIGLLLVFCYWILSRGALILGKSGHIDPLMGAWLGNALFLLLGLFLYRKTDG